MSSTDNSKTQSQALVYVGESSEASQLSVPISAKETPALLDYWRLFSRRRWSILSCLLVVFTTVAIGTLRQKPVYMAKVVIEITPELPSVLNFREFLQVGSSDANSYRETQYRILQSKTLAERVVRDLGLYYRPEFYRARPFFGLYENDPKNIPSPSDAQPPDATSEAFGNSVKHFSDMVDVSPIRRSNLVEISYFSEDPQLAARVANQLAADYIDQNLQVKWDETLKASEWLQGRLGEMKASLERSEDKLQAYAQKNSILFIDDKKNTATARLDQLQTEYTKAQADRFEKESLHSLIQAGKVQNLPGVLSNKLIQDLSVRQAELQREYAELSTKVKPEYPKALEVKKQIDTLQANIDREKMNLTQNITDEYQAAVAREEYLAHTLEEQKADVNAIAEKSIQYNILKREVDSNRQLYDGLLQRLKEAQVSAGLKSSNIRIVDAADIPKRPVKPRVVFSLALGLVLGLALGVGLATLQEYLDNTIKGTDEVEQWLRLPSLGVLPAFATNGAKNAKALRSDWGALAVKEETPRSGRGVQSDYQVIEAFRSLRTSILLSASPVPRLILITSSMPREGKTTTSVNLGVTLASLGSRVVIVDCDMRRPTCHSAFGVNNGPGFVQCLTESVSLSEAVLPAPHVENLSVIPCGPIPPNPAELLSSPMAGKLFQRLREDFDYVLIDSPPLLAVADSRILATLVDAVVLVVRARQTTYEAASEARSLLYGAGARVLGVALNDMNFVRDGYYGYSYGTYASHYGYGADARKEEQPMQDGKS